MAIPFSAPEFALWGAMSCAEGVVLLALVRARTTKIISSIRLYIAIQLAVSVSLFLLSLGCSQEVYVSAYALGTVLVYAAELNIAMALYEELKGRSNGFGTLRTWGVLSMSISAAIICFGLISHPVHTSRCILILYSLKQVGGVVRIIALLIVAVYGLLMASSWRGRTGLVWLAMSINVGSEFLCTSLAIRFPEYEPVLRHGPDAGFALALLMWSMAGSPRPALKTEQKNISGSLGAVSE